MVHNIFCIGKTVKIDNNITNIREIHWCIKGYKCSVFTVFNILNPLLESILE